MKTIKRNGSRVDYEPDKIYQALLKAANSVFVLTDEMRAHLAEVTRKVTVRTNPIKD